MASQVNCSGNPAVKLIDGDGNFNQNIGRDLKLADKNGRFTVVSIFGVQGTGKSTLLNKCLNTSFQVLPPKTVPSKMTTGVLIAISPQNADYSILALDTEGSDSAEGDESFEKKTTLFALSVSNIVIFNMKCENVSLRGGTSGPLMENVFEAMVRIRKFSTPRQINLLVVLRDRTECPLDKLAMKLREQLQKIWDGLPKPSNSVNAKLEEYFKIDVVALPHFKYEENEFESEVIGLREKINSLVEPSRQLYSASGFVALAESNWNDIKDDKILNISINRIKVAGVLCNQILMEKIEKFMSQDQPWIRIENDVDSGTVVRGFGNKVSTIIGDYISQYDEETLSLDESTRLKHRDQLTRLLLKEVRPAYLSLVRVARDTILSNYQKKIVENIRKGSNAFEKSEVDKFIRQYQTLMEDICIKQAYWVHVDCEQLERMRSELASIEKGGLYVATQRTLLKSKKKVLTAKAIKVTVLAAIGVAVTGGIGVMGGVAFVSGFVGATAAVQTLGSVAAVIEAATGIVASLGSAATALLDLMPMYNDYREIKREFEDTCQRDPIKWALYRQI